MNTTGHDSTGRARACIRCCAGAVCGAGRVPRTLHRTADKPDCHWHHHRCSGRKPCRSPHSGGLDVGVMFAAVLRLAIVLYGFRITFTQIADVGLAGFVLDATKVFGTLAFGTVIGTRWLGMDKATAILTSAGAAIWWGSRHRCNRTDRQGGATQDRARHRHRGDFWDHRHVPLSAGVPRRVAPHDGRSVRDVRRRNGSWGCPRGGCRGGGRTGGGRNGGDRQDDPGHVARSRSVAIGDTATVGLMVGRTRRLRSRGLPLGLWPSPASTR